MYYSLNIAGIKRDLPLCKIRNDIWIAAFILLGDSELTVACAKELLDIAPDYDIAITAETKGIPLVHEMARQSCQSHYIVARKSVKFYMENTDNEEHTSFTTTGKQTLYITSSDVKKIKGKRVLLVDDVITTGESLNALEKLVIRANGIVAGRLVVLAEGNAKYRTDIQYLSTLPLFNENGDQIVL